MTPSFPRDGVSGKPGVIQCRSYLVDNGAHAHSAVPYLTDAVTGAAIAAGLR